MDQRVAAGDVHKKGSRKEKRFTKREKEKDGHDAGCRIGREFSIEDKEWR